MSHLTFSQGGGSATSFALLGRGDLSLLMWPCATVDPEIEEQSEFRLVETPAGGFRRFPRVSSIVGDVGQGGWLAKWIARTEQAAFRAAAVETLGRLSVDGSIDPQAAIGAMHKLTPQLESERIRDQAASFGSRLHGLIERYLKHAEVPSVFHSQDLSRAFHCWLSWWRASGLRCLAIEQRVACAVCGFSGTLDALVEDQAGLVRVVDWKSSRRLREGMTLQVSAYHHASPIPAQGALLVRIPHGPRAKVEAHYLEPPELAIGFDVFQAALKLYRWVRAETGQDAGDNPIGSHDLQGDLT